MKDERWLVTGGLGFIGSTFVRMVLRDRPGVSIVNLDAMTYAANPANLAEVEGSPRYRFVRGDICDASAVAGAISGGVDVIVNFAAETHVDRSILGPSAFIRTDVFGTHVLLEAARREGTRRFLHVSTDEVYGDVPSGRSDERAPIAPRSPYSASKAGGELQALAYASTYDLPVVITRGSNTYGPHQHPEKLIPLFITRLIDGESVPLYGDGEQIRDWIHVEDHARGILTALERGENGQVYNVGGGRSQTNMEITERLVALCGRSMTTHVRHVRDRPGHDRRYAVDATKLRALGWAPRIDFDDGIARTVAWYAGNEGWWRTKHDRDFAAYYARQYAGR